MYQINENAYFSRRESAYIPKVQDQGIAGTCCIFASLSGLSWAVALKYGKQPPTLSPQHCVDNIRDYNSSPLYNFFTGTQLDVVLNFLKNTGAVLSCDYHEYTGIIQPAADNAIITYKLVDYSRIHVDDHRRIQDNIREKIVIGVIRTFESFNTFNGNGIYVGLPLENTSEVTLHAILITGYGMWEGLPYYEVLNSHGDKYLKRGGFLFVSRFLFVGFYVIEDVCSIESSSNTEMVHAYGASKPRKSPLIAASVSSGVGSRVWVEDQDVAWMDGEVLAVSGDDVKVLCTSGNAEKVPIEEVLGQLKCSREGLSTDEVANRLQIFGPNKLEEKIEAVVIATGEIEAVVIATGVHTFFGKATHLLDCTNQVGHFHKVLTAIGNFCICSIAVGMLIEIVVMYPIQHRKYRDGIDNLLVLLIGGVPIAMPTVLSVTMAIGSHRLSQQGAVTKRMTAIVEMAGMDVLCSVKTGTPTLNKLSVDKNLIEVFAKGVDKEHVMLLAARASRTENQDAIDTTIVGMLADPKEARAGVREIHFFPFNPVDKRIALTYIDNNGNWHRASKGAPEQILTLCNCKEDQKRKVHSIIDKYADRGLRSLAVAKQEVPEKSKDAEGRSWQFVGLLPLFDPPRHDSAETIRQALHLGVNVKMITGNLTTIL